MNNDISADVNKYISNKASSRQMSSSEANVEISKAENIDSESIKNSFDYLGSLGHAQVNMNKLTPSKTTKEAVKSFVNDPEYAKAHVELCDELVSRGYKLEDAIMKTDKIFNILSDKNTYTD